MDAKLACRLWLTALLLLAAAPIQAATAPDPTRRGPYAVGEGTYTSAAKRDPELATELATDLAAAVWYPKNAPASVPRPLLVFLSGNHSTCGWFDRQRGIRVDDDISYTYDGKCPKGYVQAPSHLGFRYLGQRLAEWGYVVVSINANRGINAAPETYQDPGLIVSRGKLILRHLERLGQWNRAGGAPKTLGFDPRGRLDFANIGMLGHSRGGDAIVAAAELLADATKPWKRRLPTNTLVRGLFAIAPTDYREVGPTNLAYAVLLPMCDADVADLAGLQFFERAMRAEREQVKAIKATFAVWGANHNFYNTEWQESDSSGCVGHASLFGARLGSAKQRETAIQPVLGFFRGTVGRNANPIFARILDSTYRPAAPFRDLTRLTRGWSSSPDPSVSRVLERFDRTSLKSAAGVAHKLTRMTGIPVVIPDHERQGLALYWRNATVAKPSSATITLAKPGQSVNVRIYSSVEIRMTRGCGGELAFPFCYDEPPINDDIELEGDIRLIDAAGKRSLPVPIAAYADLYSPVGADFDGNYFLRHPVLSTLRIPVVAFKRVDLQQIKAIELSFGKQAKGLVYVADLRVSRAQASYPSGTYPAAPAVSAAPAANTATFARLALAPADDRTSVSFRRSAGIDPAGRQVALVEVVARSSRPFPVTGNGLMLQIGDLAVKGGSFVARDDAEEVLFRIGEPAFLALAEGAPITVRGLASQPAWTFPPLRKADLQ